MSRLQFCMLYFYFFFSSRRGHTRCLSDWISDVCSSDLGAIFPPLLNTCTPPLARTRKPNSPDPATGNILPAALKEHAAHEVGSVLPPGFAPRKYMSKSLVKGPLAKEAMSRSLKKVPLKARST